MANFLLVHGAFYGGWYWKRVAARLRAKGHEVWTPTLTGCGERHHLLTRETTLSTHIEDIVNVLRFEDLYNVILVGHSYAGVVITGVTDRARGRISALVYVDATVPENGQNASGQFPKENPSAESASFSLPDDQWLFPAVPPHVMGVTDPDDLQWVADKRLPHPMRSLLEPIRLSHGEPNHISRTFIHCRRQEALVQFFGANPLQASEEKAKREGFVWRELDTGHDAMITKPAELTDLLLEAAG